MPNNNGESKRGHNFISGNHFVKQYACDVLLEFEKAERLFEISRDSRVFESPQPKELDEDRSQISYTLMREPVESIREIYVAYLKSKADPELATSVFGKAGRALGTIHRDMRLSQSSTWEVPVAAAPFNKVDSPISVNDQANWVFLHCDYGFSNIFIKNARSSAEPELWVIDPSPNYFMTESVGLVGPAEVDIANFAACMHGLFPISRQFNCDWSLAYKLLDVMIAEYEQESCIKIDRELLHRIVNLTLSTYVSQRLKYSLAQWLALRMLRSDRRTAGLYRT